MPTIHIPRVIVYKCKVELEEMAELWIEYSSPVNINHLLLPELPSYLIVSWRTTVLVSYGSDKVWYNLSTQLKFNMIVTSFDLT